MSFFRRHEMFAALVAPRSRRKAMCSLVSLLSIPFTSIILSAQTPDTGAISGVVLSSGRKPLASVTVLSTNVEDGVSRSASTGPNGTFLLVGLPVGEYAVSLTTSGSTLSKAGTVHVGLGGTTEILLRFGSPALLRDLPEMQSSLEPDENGDGLTTARGLEPTQNGAVVDGIGGTQSYGAVPMGTGSDPTPDPDGDSDSAEETNGPANGMARGRHAGIAYVFSEAAIREFRVTGNSYSAQTGHSGEVATTVTRSGGSQFHGSGFFTLRSQVFAAESPLAIATSYADGVVTTSEVKPHDLRESFGGSLGGPVPRLKHLNFFYSFDQERRGFPAVSSPVDPNFYNLTATQIALLGNRGVTGAQRSAGLDYISSLTGSTPRRADQTLNFGRLDWHLRPKLTVSLEYNRVRWNSPAGLLDAPVVGRGRASLGNAAGNLDLVMARVSSSFGNHLTNAAHAAYIADTQYETPQSPLPQEPAISPGGLSPEVNIGPNGLLFGTPASLSQIVYPDERRVEFADTLTYVTGRHLIEVGGSVALVQDTVATLANAAGTFSYDSGFTGGKAGGLVDFLTDYTYSVHAANGGGCPSIYATTHLFCFRSFSQSFGESSVTFPIAQWAGFTEDTWRPRTDLTLHVGARYEYTLLPIPSNPNPVLDAIFGSRGATSVFPEDRNNLGPRASASWEPFGSGRGLVRIGYGIFFGQIPGAMIRAALSDTGQTSSTTRVRIRPSAIVTCPQALTSGFGYPCAFTAQPPGVVAATTSAMVFDRRFRLPTVQQGNIALERNIGWHTKVAANYVFNLDRQLPSSTDINIAQSITSGLFQLHGGTGAPGVQDAETFRLPMYTSRVSPSFGPVTDIVSNVNATYSGLTLQIESRPILSVSIRADYTLSRAIDFGQAQSSTPRTNGQLDPFSTGYDKGLSSLNYPHAFHFEAIWKPKEQFGPALVRTIATGWQFTPIVIARSGRPYSFDLSGGTYLPGGHESLNGSGGALYLPTVGRNTLRLPPTINVNLRAARSFPAGKRARVSATVEAFNLCNHQNVTSVTQRAYLVGTAVSGVTPLVFQSAAQIAIEGLNTQPFGTPTATGTSLARERQVQIALKLDF